MSNDDPDERAAAMKKLAETARTGEPVLAALRAALGGAADGRRDMQSTFDALTDAVEGLSEEDEEDGS